MVRKCFQAEIQQLWGTKTLRLPRLSYVPVQLQLLRQEKAGTPAPTSGNAGITRSHPSPPQQLTEKLHLQRHNTPEVTSGLNLGSEVPARRGTAASVTLLGRLHCHCLFLCVFELNSQLRGAISLAPLVNDTENSLQFYV